MDNNYHDRQRQIEQEHDRQKAKLQKHATVETWSIEQGEAHQGKVPSADGADVERPKPGLLTRLWKMITGR